MHDHIGIKQIPNFQGALDITCSVESHGAAVDFARSGTGIALTSSMIAAPCLRDGSLIQLEPEGLEAHDGYYLSIAQNDNADLSQKFSQWLEREIAAVDQQN